MDELKPGDWVVSRLDRHKKLLVRGKVVEVKNFYALLERIQFSLPFLEDGS